MNAKTKTPYKALILALRRSKASIKIVASELLYELQQLGYMKASLQPISEEEMEDMAQNKLEEVRGGNMELWKDGEETKYWKEVYVIGFKESLSRGVAKESVPSDEEIEREAKNRNTVNAFVTGAKWLRDRLSMSTTSKESEWISVEDRLPEKGQDVLVFRKSTITDGYVIDSGAYGFFEDKIWGEKDGDNWIVSHWQPLPKPPTVK